MSSKYSRLIFFLAGLVIALVIYVGYLKQNTFQYAKQYYLTSLQVFHSRVDKNSVSGSVVLIGDSLIQGLNSQQFIPKSLNFGIGLDTSLGVTKRLRSYKSIGNASCIFVHVGINDLLKDIPVSQIEDNYRQLLNVFNNEQKVIVSAILPVSNGFERAEVIVSRAQKINATLFELTRLNENFYWSDIRPLFGDKSGFLKSGFHIGDGLHLNAEGNKLWLGLIRDRLAEVGCMRDNQ